MAHRDATTYLLGPSAVSPAASVSCPARHELSAQQRVKGVETGGRKKVRATEDNSDDHSIHHSFLLLFPSFLFQSGCGGPNRETNERIIVIGSFFSSFLFFFAVRVRHR